MVQCPHLPVAMPGAYMLCWLMSRSCRLIVVQSMHCLQATYFTDQRLGVCVFPVSTTVAALGDLPSAPPADHLQTPCIIATSGQVLVSMADGCA